MDIKKVLGQNTRRYRIALGYTQAKLAVAFGSDRAYISAIERGKQNMTALRILELATALNVQPAQLMTPIDVGTETPSPD